MEKNRGTAIAVIVALVVSVISLGVAFATFSTTLNINGSATVQATKWDIYFADSDFSNNTAPARPSANATLGNRSISNALGTATVNTTNTNATYVSPTAISWTASLKSPGDKVVWDFYVINAGDYDAKVTNTPVATATGATNGGITCTKNSTGETTVCPHIHYGLYEDSNLTTAVAQNTSTVAHKNSAHYYLAVWLDNSYGEDGTELADDTVTTATITTTLTYGQVGSAQ